MKRLLFAAVVLGVSIVAGAAQAAPPWVGGPDYRFAGHGHHHRAVVLNECHRPAVQFYSAAPVCQPAIVAPPLVYSSFYQPGAFLSFAGQNFAVRVGF